jgi:phosphatidylglycerol lysyltransferase
MGRRILRIVLPTFGLAVFCLALWALYHELKTYHLKDILHSLRSLPRPRVLLALAFTALSYTAATGYDTLSTRYIRRPVRYGRTALAAFIGTTFSNNLGFGILTGGSVRLRLYTAWGLSALEISKLVLYNTVTLWLGFLGLGGLVFALEPLAVPQALRLPFLSVRPVGLIFLSMVVAYFVLTLVLRRPLRLKEEELPAPPARLFPFQIVVSFVDWAVAGATLYVLLPAQAGLSFPGFLGIYMLALLAGIFSQVPGGLGVFETVFVLLMSSRLPASVVLGSLLAYRGIYYFLPLAAAFVLLGTQELSRKKEQLLQATDTVGRWSSVVGPPVLSVLTIAAGIVLLVSGATAAVPARMAWLERILPLPIVETSHFMGSVVGILLVFLAWGVQRRLDAAYLLTSVLLGAGIVFSLLKGADYEEAIILAGMLVVFLPGRRYFYRKASLFRPSASAGWIVAVLFAIIGTAWLTRFGHKHVEYSGELWWRFAFDAHAPRSLRALTGAAVAALLVSVAMLLRPHRRPASASAPPDEGLVESIVGQSPDSAASLALLGDKRFLLSPNARAFIMYGHSGRSCVSMGDPVGPQEEWPELVWSFREMADRNGYWTVFYEAGAGTLEPYLDLGLTLHKLGEEGRVSLPSFSLEGGERKKLRYTVNSLEREGVSFAVVPKQEVPPLLGELRRISDSWLVGKSTREKSFSLGRFDEQYLSHFPIAVVRLQDRIVAFSNLWGAANPEELSIDLMRHLPEAPAGTMEYLFVRLMLWGKDSGYRWFSLGMVPFAGLADHSLAPLWNRLGTLLFQHGEAFYNFQGLRKFKEKFDPVWRPRYLASPGGLALPTVLANVASLVSGGIRGLVTK